MNFHTAHMTVKPLGLLWPVFNHCFGHFSAAPSPFANLSIPTRLNAETTKQTDRRKAERPSILQTVHTFRFCTDYSSQRFIKIASRNSSQEFSHRSTTSQANFAYKPLDQLFLLVIDGREVNDGFQTFSQSLEILREFSRTD